MLVDEVNRASPKTQSGLLECMQERHVTVDATSHELARPFLVFATQNPVEYEGTYPLPEAQVDRFMVRLSLGYPDAEAEAGMLARPRVARPACSTSSRSPTAPRSSRPSRPRTACTPPRALRDYIVALLRRTRDDERVELGASPRAGLMLLRAAKARALVHGRDHALPDDVQALAEAVLSHRLMLAPEAAGVQRAEIVARRDRRGPGAVAMRSALGMRRARPAAAGRRGHVRRRAAVRHRRRAAAARRGRAGAGSGSAASGAKLTREIGARSVIEEQPLQVKLHAQGRAGCRCRRAGSTSRCCPTPLRLPAGRRQARVRIEVTFGRRGRRRLPPPALVLRDPFGLAQRVIAGPGDGRDPRAPADLPGERDRGRGRRDPGARARVAARRGRDRDRRPAPVARGLARLAHPLAVVRARRAG